MAFIPLLLNHHLKTLDSHFGVGLDPEDILTATSTCPHLSQNCGRQMSLCSIPWKTIARSLSRQERGSKVSEDKDQFQVSLDVQHFNPDEIIVKVVGGHIVVEANHEEKQDDHGYISRHFVRKYSLPSDHKSEDVVSSLSSDGVLTITAPRKVSGSLDGERIVPITSTEQSNTHITNGTN